MSASALAPVADLAAGDLLVIDVTPHLTEEPQHARYEVLAREPGYPAGRSVLRLRPLGEASKTVTVLDVVDTLPFPRAVSTD